MNASVSIKSGNGVTPMPADDALALHRTMVRIRAFEETCLRLYKQGQLRGGLHLSIGQEAVAAGVCGALEHADMMTTTHRGHGHCIAKGAGIQAMADELCGREGGVCKGRGGSMHLADASLGMLGANAIVGGGIAIATGAALSAQALGDRRVAVAIFGEGAVAQGAFHESLNMAALWKLPVIFVVENNQYAELTHIRHHLANTAVATFGQSYGIHSEAVDGNDVAAVWAAADAAIARARAGHGPTLLEMKTYRLFGHFAGDPEQYRSREEVAEWKLKDPLLQSRERLLAANPALSEALDAMVADAAAEMALAFENAFKSAEPALETLLEDIYA